MGTDFDKDVESRRGLSNLTASAEWLHEIAVALLTGGSDRPYVFGLTTSLMSKGAALDLIGSDELDCPEFHGKPGVNFLNLRGDQRPDVSFREKVSRVSMYYAKLIRYAATAKPKIFHILWNNKIRVLRSNAAHALLQVAGEKDRSHRAQCECRQAGL